MTTASPTSRTAADAGTELGGPTAAMHPSLTSTAAGARPSGVRTRRPTIARSGTARTLAHGAVNGP
jgi:hypothetical protein